MHGPLFLINTSLSLQLLSDHDRNQYLNHMDSHHKTYNFLVVGILSSVAGILSMDLHQIYTVHQHFSSWFLGQLKSR